MATLWDFKRYKFIAYIIIIFLCLHRSQRAIVSLGVV